MILHVVLPNFVSGSLAPFSSKQWTQNPLEPLLVAEYSFEPREVAHSLDVFFQQSSYLPLWYRQVLIFLISMHHLVCIG